MRRSTVVAAILAASAVAPAPALGDAVCSGRDSCALVLEQRLRASDPEIGRYRSAGETRLVRICGGGHSVGHSAAGSAG
jgi:hypothetical protein